MSKSSKTALIPHDPSLKDKAREMYLAHKPHNDICAELKLNSSTLANWRKSEDWAVTRKAADENLINDLVEGRKLKLAVIMDMSVEALNRFMKSLRDRPDPVSIQEAEKLSIIIGNLHKVNLLDSNRATENLSVKMDVTGLISPERILDALRADPFLPATDKPPAA